MRLWSLHPKYLDRQGLLAVWREGLLAQKVLQGKTKGYRHHPQLQRFREQKDPLAAIGAYLRGIYDESLSRGYRFDQSKIASRKKCPAIRVASGQLEYEFGHLLKKLRERGLVADPGEYWRRHRETHPLFKKFPGARETWEKAGSSRK
jgi:hypothetical protein